MPVEGSLRALSLHHLQSLWVSALSPPSVMTMEVEFREREEFNWMTVWLGDRLEAGAVSLRPVTPSVRVRRQPAEEPLTLARREAISATAYCSVGQQKNC